MEMSESKVLEMLAAQLRGDAAACDQLEGRRRQALVARLLESTAGLLDVDQLGDNGLWTIFALSLQATADLASSYLPNPTPPAEPEYSATMYQAFFGQRRPAAAKRVPVTLTYSQLEELQTLVRASLRDIESRKTDTLWFFDDVGAFGGIKGETLRLLAAEVDHCLRNAPAGVQVDYELDVVPTSRKVVPEEQLEETAGSTCKAQASVLATEKQGKHWYVGVYPDVKASDTAVRPTSRKVVLPGIPVEKRDVWREWYAKVYPGVPVEFVDASAGTWDAETTAKFADMEEMAAEEAADLFAEVEEGIAEETAVRVAAYRRVGEQLQAARRYQVVSSQSVELLSERVNDLMTEGWRPSGGVVVDVIRPCDYDHPDREPVYVYYQAMARRSVSKHGIRPTNEPTRSREWMGGWDFYVEKGSK